jgi:hypothetical protein
VHRRLIAVLLALGAGACQSSGAPQKTGAAGTSGAAGSAGIAGTTGAAGTSGAAGSTGQAGAAAGTSGVAGTMGAAGMTAPPDAAVEASADAPAGIDLAPDGASGACPTGAILCEDFESYDTPASLAAAWKVTATAATLVVDGSKPYRGAKGVHISAPGGTPVGTLIKENAPNFPIAGNVMYGRLMMWLTKAPTGAVHWNNVQSAGFMPGSTQWSKYGWGGMYGTILAGYTIRTSPTDSQAVIDCSKPSAMGLPEKKWTCLEWEFDGVGNELHLWLDGKLVADADVVKMGTQCVTPKPPNGIWQAPTFANLTLGWAQYQASNVPIDFWMDDVVVATKPVGCPPPP